MLHCQTIKTRKKNDFLFAIHLYKVFIDNLSAAHCPSQFHTFEEQYCKKKPTLFPRRISDPRSAYIQHFRPCLYKPSRCRRRSGFSMSDIAQLHTYSLDYIRSTLTRNNAPPLNLLSHKITNTKLGNIVKYFERKHIYTYVVCEWTSKSGYHHRTNINNSYKQT